MKQPPTTVGAESPHQGTKFVENHLPFESRLMSHDERFMLQFYITFFKGGFAVHFKGYVRVLVYHLISLLWPDCVIFSFFQKGLYKPAFAGDS